MRKVTRVLMKHVWKVTLKAERKKMEGIRCNSQSTEKKVKDKAIGNVEGTNTQSSECVRTSLVAGLLAPMKLSPSWIIKSASIPVSVTFSPLLLCQLLSE